ncbi:MAG: hypothetical protein ACXV74_11405 [Methylobacter sp.]
MIQSFYAPIKQGPVTYIALDTLFKRHHSITAMGIGRIENEQPVLSDIGQQTLQAVQHFIGKHAPSTALMFWEVGDTDKIKVTKRLKEGLKAAMAYQKSAVFFVCKNSHVYDAVYEALHVDDRKPSIH